MIESLCLNKMNQSCVDPYHDKIIIIYDKDFASIIDINFYKTFFVFFCK